MTEKRDAHVKKHGGGNFEIAVAGKNIERETQDCGQKQNRRDNDERVHIAAQQGFIDEQL